MSRASDGEGLLSGSRFTGFCDLGLRLFRLHKVVGCKDTCFRASGFAWPPLPCERETPTALTLDMDLPRGRES